MHATDLIIYALAVAITVAAYLRDPGRRCSASRRGSDSSQTSRRGSSPP